MKLNEQTLANTLGVLGALYFIICYVVAAVMPELYKTVSASWMHMLKLDSLWRTGPHSFLLGFLSFTIVSWVSGFLFAKVYNYFLAKK